MSEPVPLFGPTSVLGRFIIPHPPLLLPSASPFCVWGSERDMSMNPPPPIHGTSVTAKSLQPLPNLLLGVVRNVRLDRKCTFGVIFVAHFQARQLKLQQFPVPLCSLRPHNTKQWDFQETLKNDISKPHV